MIKKLQEYLLTNYPLIWNTKVVPMILSAIILNILFYIISYSKSSIDFSEAATKYNNLWIINVIAVLLIILIIIVWLITYSKNNAFKVFYPKSTNKLYAEWFLIFIIITSLCLIPFSFYMGGQNKFKSYITEDELLSAVENINMINILIPEDKRSYFQEYPGNYNSSDSDEIETAASQYYLNDQIDSIAKVRDKQTDLAKYPNFTVLSLLNKNVYNMISTHSYKNTLRQLKDGETVKEWLVQENKEEIRKLITSHLALLEKHDLKTNLTTDKWMDLIYNPPQYPVSDFNLISRYSPEKYYDQHLYYVEYRNLADAYYDIFNAYYNSYSGSFLLTVVCIAGILSLLLFSFRISSGKSWLIALVATGILGILNVIVMLFTEGIIHNTEFSASNIFIIYWLFVFIFELVFIINKNIKNRAKGISRIMINHLIWFIPLIPILIYSLIYFYHYEFCWDNDYALNNCSFLTFTEKHISELIWANVAFSFISVWAFIKWILMKWKSLPEQ